MSEKRVVLKTNKAAWDVVAEKFAGGLYLPAWGPFGELKNENLLGSIKGKTFLEIGFGSGHSVEYLIKMGAKKVYGVDISIEQLKLATELNKNSIAQGKVVLRVDPMEKKFKLPEKVDVVFSDYAIGWTVDINRTFTNIKSYLKSGGKFVWSWEHPFYSRSVVENNQLLIDKSYITDGIRLVSGWVGSDSVYIQHRKLSTWINALHENGFVVEKMHEPLPEVFSESAEVPTKYYSRFKAEMVTATVVFECVLK